VTKQLPCCARLQTTLLREEAALSQAARRANRAVGSGRSMIKAQAEIAKLRSQIADTKASIEAHEAEHAGTPA
jgi:hypothetical protein